MKEDATISRLTRSSNKGRQSRESNIQRTKADFGGMKETDRDQAIIGHRSEHPAADRTHTRKSA